MNSSGKSKDIAVISDSDEEASDQQSENDLTVEAWLRYGIPRDRRLHDVKFKKVQLDTPIITKYPPIKTFHRTFYNFVDESIQPFDARKCNFMLDTGVCNYESRDLANIRIHHLTHYKGAEFIKYPCSRCKRNFEMYQGLTDHAKRGQCVQKSDFPMESYFMDLCLKEHPAQHPKSKSCSICAKEFDSSWGAKHHFLSCAKYIIKCINCTYKNAEYNQVRKHYEQECDGTDKMEGRKQTRFIDDKILPPSDDDDKIWTDAMMIEHMRTTSIPKFIALFDRFPKPAFGTIGMTKTPVKRWSSYVGSAEVYGKSESSPQVKNNELILFSCWSKSIARRYEYLMQLHTIQKEGKFFKLVGHRMNPQSVYEPVQKDTPREPHYVYCQFTRSPYTTSVKKSSAAPTASTSAASTSHQSPQPSTSTFRPPASSSTIVISDDDDSDEDIAPVARKKTHPRFLDSSSSDEDDAAMQPPKKK